MSQNGFHYFEQGLRDYRPKFNRQPFQFQHSLAGHPLFELPRLVELVLSRPSQDFYFDQGEASVGQRWGSMPAKTLSLPEAIQKIEHAQAWIVINHAERAPEYRQLLDQALDEVLGDWEFRNQIKSREVIIFVSSPRRVTTYHIDRECNFLLQVSGEKTVYIFDRDDREILTEREIEQFWSRDNNAAQYKPQYQDRALAVPLTSGTGVHIPVNYPHWVQNGDCVSVSVSINFQFHDRTRANIYRMNYALRQLGLDPTPPGRVAWKDSLKGLAMTPLVAGGRVLRRNKSA
jgi:hypothetical protein